MVQIDVQSLSKTYEAGTNPTLQDVSFTVQPGEFVALMGPSGCGKSTLLNILGAIDTPTTGAVIVAGTSLSLLSEEERTQFRRHHVGFVFQFFNLLDTLTVAENIRLPLALNGAEENQNTSALIHSMLAQVGLDHRANYYPSKLSGGEMQRVAIARALIHNPTLILADEPTGNLDSKNGAMVLDQLTTLAKEQGKTILMATHSEEAANRADRVLRMKDGQLLVPAHTSG